MVLPPEIRTDIEEISRRRRHLIKFIDVASKTEQIKKLEEKMGEPSFWDNHERAQKVISEVNGLKRMTKPITEFSSKWEDAEAMIELLAELNEAEGQEYLLELQTTLARLKGEMETLEIQSFLSGPHDKCNAFLSIHAGAGGTESCDWAEMMMRMYLRWAERRGFQIEIQDIQPGEGAGISSATIRIVGQFAYGYCKAERGVHRLVRISPFDANKKRHTSFASVDVVAEIEDDIEVDIDEEDLRIDTYRSGGKGGQHANKTESAIRITHLPTGIVVTCQNERSQLKNKQSAMKALKSRLFERIQDEKRETMEKFYGEKGEIGWGNQIRSYVFQPYQMVKDLRTGVETSNVQAVMDGDLDGFVNGWLRAGSPLRRNKDIKLDD